MSHRGVMIRILLGGLFLGWSLGAEASPARGKKPGHDDRSALYIQRQDGELNVRADLDNLLILILPTQSESSSQSPLDDGLLNYLTRVASQDRYSNILQKLKRRNQPIDPQQETQHFIESKTAPYHVDISESKVQVTPTSESSLIALSPTVALGKSEIPLINKKTGRISRAVVFAVPADEEFVLTKTEDKKKVVKKDGKKKHSKDSLRGEMVLLGSEREQCGPGMVRDSYGNCRTYKKNI